MNETVSTPRLSRSSLIVPLSNEKFLAKAHLRGADNITLDLEDGVAGNAKAEARKRLAEAVPMVRRGGATVKVRLNKSLGLLVRDLEAAVIDGVDSLGIAKVESAGHVRMVADYVGELERERGLPEGRITLSASLEDPKALLQAYEIASSHPRLTAIGLGSLDLAAACGFDPTPEALLMPKQMVLLAARAAGISCGGYIGSIANYTDLEGMRQVIRRSKKLGFHGGGAIHPAQVQVLNEEFGPSKEEEEDARAIVELAKIAFAEGRGAFSYKGKMIDKPVVDAARETLAMVEMIAAQEERHRKLLNQAR